MRSYEELIKRLEEYKEYQVCFLDLLNKIEIKRKKDGTHFQNINQTFVNAEYRNTAYPELELHGRDSFGRYLSYSIYCYLYCDEMAKDDERKNKAVSRGSWSRDIYILTTDEIIERIEAEKEKQRKYIESYDLQLKESKRIFNMVDEKLKEVKSIIEEETKVLRDTNINGKPIYPSSLEYALRDYIKDSI